MVSKCCSLLKARYGSTWYEQVNELKSTIDIQFRYHSSAYLNYMEKSIKQCLKCLTFKKISNDNDMCIRCVSDLLNPVHREKIEISLEEDGYMIQKRGGHFLGTIDKLTYSELCDLAIQIMEIKENIKDCRPKSLLGDNLEIKVCKGKYTLVKGKITKVNKK